MCAPAPAEGRLSRRAVLGGAVAVAVGVAARSAGPRAVMLAAGAPAADALVDVTVTIDPTTIIGAMAPRALGFSFEKNTVPNGMFDASNAALVALFRLLGPGTLRLGGNSVERVTWDGGGPGGVANVVSPPDLVRLRSFLDATDWQAIYGTPFLFSDAAAVAAEAAAATAALGPRLESFELCNEPDLYRFDPAAVPIAGTRALMDARWTALAATIHNVVPGAVLVGPSSCLLQSYDAYTRLFAEAHPTDLAQVVQHYYRGFGATTQTIDLLLGPDPLLAQTLPKLRAAAEAAGRTYRLGETNSFANGGQAGVSNTFASALWGADLVLKAGAHGAAGVNIHNSGAGAGYPAIVNVAGVVTEIRPLFHGLLLAAAAGTGPMAAVSVGPDLPALRAHAVRVGEEWRVVLVNTGADDLAVTLDAGAALARASVRRLIGPALAATTGSTFAGTAVAIDGSWSPGAPDPVPTSGASAILTVPAASGAVVTAALSIPPVTTTSTSTTSTTSTTTAPPTSSSSSTSSTSSTTTTTTTMTTTTTADPSPSASAAPASAVPAAPTFAG